MEIKLFSYDLSSCRPIYFAVELPTVQW